MLKHSSQLYTEIFQEHMMHAICLVNIYFIINS